MKLRSGSLRKYTNMTNLQLDSPSKKREDDSKSDMKEEMLQLIPQK